MNKTRRNHYVPRFLSSAFTDDQGILFFVNNHSQKPTIKSSRPNNLFVERDLYRHDGQLIDVSTDVEEKFSKIESRFAPVHQEIMQEVRKGTTPNMDWRKKSRLIAFIVAQWRKTPDQKKRMESTVNDFIARMLESTRQEIENEHGPLSPEILELVDCRAQEEYVRLAQLNEMASLSPNIQSQLKQHILYYLRIRNEKFSFVVGSNPVVWYQEMDRIVPNGRVMDVFLALSSDIALKLTAINRGPRIVDLFDGHSVQKWNERIRDQSLTIAGRSKPLVGSLFRRLN